MKNLKYFKVVSTIIVLFVISTSCSITNKMALSCPEPASRYKTNNTLNHPQPNKKSFVVAQRGNKKSDSFSKHASRSIKNQNKPVKNLRELNEQQINFASKLPKSVSTIYKIEFNSNYYAAADNSVVPVEGTYSPMTTLKDEVADFSSDEKV